jgi:SAM-dependent methyltransferase
MMQNIGMTKTCHICGALLAQTMPIVNDPITHEPFSVLRCVSCGLGHTDPQPDNLSPYYPVAYYGGRHGLTARMCIRRRLRMLSLSGLRARTPELGPPSILDIGCGDGSFLLAAKAQGWLVAGVERFPGAAREAGLTIATNTDEFQGQQFDYITLWHSLEHMTEPGKLLKQIKPLLKQDGKVIIAIPDGDGWQAKLFGRYWLHLDVPRHLYHFTQLSISEGFKFADLIVIREWHQEFEYDLLGWSQSLLNSLFPTPNVFFNWLTKKPISCRRCETFFQILTGLTFTIIFIPIVWLSSACGKGGTLIVTGGRNNV